MLCANSMGFFTNTHTRTHTHRVHIWCGQRLVGRILDNTSGSRLIRKWKKIWNQKRVRWRSHADHSCVILQYQSKFASIFTSCLFWLNGTHRLDAQTVEQGTCRKRPIPRPPCPFTIMQFPGNFKEKSPILSKFWAQGPYSEVKTLLAHLTKILDPPLIHHHFPHFQLERDRQLQFRTLHNTRKA